MTFRRIGPRFSRRHFGAETESGPRSISDKQQKQFLAKHLDTELFDLITNKTISCSKSTDSILEHIMKYKTGYVEKTVLLDEFTANSIVNSVITHSRKVGQIKYNKDVFVGDICVIEKQLGRF